MPVFFPSQGQYASFHRQLNSYGFWRLTKNGPDQKSFYHQLFLRSRPVLACLIVRSKQTANKVRRTIDPNTEPDFSRYPPLPPSALHDSAGNNQDHMISGPNAGMQGPSLCHSADDTIQTETKMPNTSVYHEANEFQCTESMHSRLMNLESSLRPFERRDLEFSGMVNLPPLGGVNRQVPAIQMANICNENGEDEDESDDSSMSFSTNYEDCVSFLEDVDFSSTFSE